MIAVGDPGHLAVGNRPQNRGQLYCQPPESEKLGAPVSGAQVSDQRPAGRLRGTQTQSCKIGGHPEKSGLRRGPGYQGCCDPQKKSESNGSHMPKAVLDVAEGERA